MARPTKLTEELFSKAESYLDSYDSLIPSAAGLSIFLDVSRATLYNWAEKDDRFLDILEKVNTHQEHKCLNGGLSGDYNSTIAKLVLGKHGYKDQQETDLRAHVETSTPVIFTDPE
jgi:hypothetical protein